MRVLFTCVPGYGHLYPLLPLARALADGGHAVAIATGVGMRSSADAAGFTTFVAGLDIPSAFTELQLRFPDREYEHLAPAEIMDWYLPHLFGEVIAPAMLQDLSGVVTRWHPDLIVHETYELAGPVIAASIDVPSVSHTLGLRFEGEVLERVAAATAPLWRAYGLQPDSNAGIYRHVCLDITPAALQSVAPSPVAASVRPLRPVAAPPLGPERLPAWMTSRSSRPLVYMTLGTNTNSDSMMFKHVLDGLAEVDVEVLIATGSTGDPAALGPVPDNAHIAQWVPQSLVLRESALVICHGGAGTTLGSLALGVPLLVLPQGADQYIISERVVACGAGVQLAPAQVTAGAVREAARQLLAPESAFRLAARQVQAEIAAMPRPEETVHHLESLVIRDHAAARA